MIGKVKLTQEQADALKDYLADCKGDISEAIDEHSNVYCDPDNGWFGDYTALNKITPSDMARALLIGYEVEKTFKVGDWVFNKSSDAVIEIIAVEYANILNGENCNVRHATPEEIKAEQERRAWKSIGREVGEFRDGDIGVDCIGFIRRKVMSINEKYKAGDLDGFYPAESFIKFGGADE